MPGSNGRTEQMMIYNSRSRCQAAVGRGEWFATSQPPVVIVLCGLLFRDATCHNAFLVADKLRARSYALQSAAPDN